MNLVALRTPQYRLYYAGAVCAVNGMWIMRIIVGWLSWEISGSVSFVGTVAAVSLLPTVFFGPIFGVMVDRSSVKTGAFITNSGMTVCIALLLLLQIYNAITPATVLAIAFFMGTITAAHHPVRLSLGPRLVQAQYVGSVVALSALNFNLARLLAPALGGVMIERLGTMHSTALILASFVPNLLILKFLAPRERPVKAIPERFMQAFVLGLQYVSQRPTLRLVIIATMVFSITIRGIADILPTIADGVFALGATGLGQMGSAVGAGALIAAFQKAFGYGGTGTRNGAFTPMIFASGILGTLALALLGSTQSWALALFSCGILGFCGTYLGVTMQSMIQTDLPDDMRGRVMSIWVVVGLGGAAIGAFGIGAMAEIFGMPAATLSTAIFGIIATVAIFIGSQKTRKKRGGH